MSDIPRRLTDSVVYRARDRCEYCGLSQCGQEATFHVDHVVPRAANGPTTVENLALACVSCSLRKGMKQELTDPETGEAVSFFNPRNERWSDHFRWDEERVVPLTPTGRATVAALALNRAVILSIRREEAERGRHPPG